MKTNQLLLFLTHKRNITLIEQKIGSVERNSNSLIERKTIIIKWKTILIDF